MAPAKPSRSSTRTGYLLATPYLILLLTFGIGPTVYAVYLSVVNTDTGAFNGIANYLAIFDDFRFWPALKHVLTYLALLLPFMTVMVLLIAFALQAKPGRLSGVTRMLYYLPGAFTGSASVLLWLFALDPSIGPFKAVLGLRWTYISDLVTTDHLPVIFALMAFTAGAGGWVVIMCGALNSIGTDVVEASRVDGANVVQQALFVKLPLMRKYVVYMLILTLSAGLQVFVEPAIISPILHVGSNSWSLNQLALTVGINEGKLGQSAALSLCLLMVGIVAALFLIYRTDFFDTKETQK